MTESNNKRRRTFLVQVLNEQNDTLQGVITWTDTGQSRAFRSVMELMYLMESVQEDEIRQDRRKAN